MKFLPVVLCLSLSATASAQSLTVPSAPLQPVQSVPPAQSAAPAGSSREAAVPLFAPLGSDFVRFFSSDTAKVVGVFAAAAFLAKPADRQTVDTFSANLTRGVAHTGNSSGSMLVQTGAGLATYVAGRASGNREIASLGGEVVRAQLLSQAFVQGAKFIVQRERPDGSNRVSFPSGHTASAFATATVVQQHYGWKAGVPAYALAGAVAASRMASNKHYLSDVLVGAGIGIAAGRTVSFKVGREKFALGAAPTAGGAMVTFTKH